MLNVGDSKLENADNWDFSKAELRNARKSTRVVCSVAFNREDFEKLSRYSTLIGKKVSEFIREAALEKAFGNGNLTYFTAFSGSLGALSYGSNFALTFLENSNIDNPDDVVLFTNS